jgi:hypothetical protein
MLATDLLTVDADSDDDSLFKGQFSPIDSPCLRREKQKLKFIETP